MGYQRFNTFGRLEEKKAATWWCVTTAPERKDLCPSTFDLPPLPNRVAPTMNDPALRGIVQYWNTTRHAVVPNIGSSRTFGWEYHRLKLACVDSPQVVIGRAFLVFWPTNGVHHRFNPFGHCGWSVFGFDAWVVILGQVGLCISKEFSLMMGFVGGDFAWGCGFGFM